MFKSILVLLDGSPFAEHALPLASSIARHTRATLGLLQVLPPLSDRFFWVPLPASELEHDLNEHYYTEARAYLEGISHHLKYGLELDVACDVLDECIDITEAVVKSVADRRVDLIVMASHARSGFDRFRLGSIGDQIYRSVTVPVILVRPQEAAVDLTREAQLRHILVALDGSPLAEQVFSTVLSLGEAVDADFRLVRVRSTPFFAFARHGHRRGRFKRRTLRSDAPGSSSVCGGCCRATSRGRQADPGASGRIRRRCRRHHRRIRWNRSHRDANSCPPRLLTFDSRERRPQSNTQQHGPCSSLVSIPFV